MTEKTLYRILQAGGALMCAALVAAPVWDWWHYRPVLSSRCGPAALGAAITALPEVPSPAATSQHAGPVQSSAASDPRTALRMASPGGVAGAASAGSFSPSPAPGSATPLVLPAAARPQAAPPAAIASGVREAAGTLSAKGGRGPVRSPVATAPLAAGMFIPAGFWTPPAPVESPLDPPPTPYRPRSPSPDDTPIAPEPAPDGDGTPRLRLLPSSTRLDPGQVLRVAVALSALRGVSSVPFHVRFNPEVLEFLGAREGPVFTSSSLQPLLIASVNPSRPGDLAVGLSIVESSGFLETSGSLLILEFRALGRGRSDLMFDRASVRGPISEEVPVELAGASVEVR